MDFILNFFGYLLGVWTADSSLWSTGDILWGLWLSSFCAGHLIILSLCGSIAGSGLWMTAQPGYSDKLATRIRYVAGGVGSFIFFSFHYCWFHILMASFLDNYFPGRLSGSYFNPWLIQFDLLSDVWHRLLPHYWPFVLGTIIAERAHILAPLRKARDFIEEARTRLIPIYGYLEKDVSMRYSMDAFLWDTYIKMVWMYLLTAVLLFQAHFKNYSFSIFMVAYGLYCFPWRKVFDSTPKVRVPAAEQKRVRPAE